jgi:squalene-hopene/tetraprenyl-beta-curcumene cyclase
MEGGGEEEIDKAVERTRDFFFREQLPDGYWWAELESNATITSEYIMLFHFLGMVDKVRERKMARYILAKQTEEGSWTVWFGGPGDLSTTIESYFALKLGYSADHQPDIHTQWWSPRIYQIPGPFRQFSWMASVHAN